MNQNNHQGTFYGLGIAPALLDILEKLKYTVPTPIQHHAIPVAIDGKDLIGVAQTGTGKTLAFCIPMLQSIAQNRGRGLIVLPTRELALQVDEVFHKVGRQFGLRSAVLIGGASMGNQIQSLKKDPHVIVATPGRLNDHLQSRWQGHRPPSAELGRGRGGSSIRNESGQKPLSLAKITILVLDEADRMLDMGFLPQIQKILNALPKQRQTMLFSATLPPAIMRIATSHMKLPLHIEISPSGTASENVMQEIFIVRKDAKIRLLEKVLGEYKGSALVFVRTKYIASRIARAVRAMGHTATEIHSNRSLGQRKDALSGFKKGTYRVLIATDIAARGIDVLGIELVVNYDLPSNSEDYVHRIGRTGRAGAEGHAISFALPEEQYEIRSIEKLIRKNLRVSPAQDLPPESSQLAEHLYKENQRRHSSAPSRSGGYGGQRRFSGSRRSRG